MSCYYTSDMASQCASEEELIQRHKQEKKSLQAEIQKLKHSVTKGDRKKKKEINEKIAVLEAEIDKRHDKELAEFKLNGPSETGAASADSALCDGINQLKTEENPGDTEGAGINTKKTSKAQKRRDKKAAQDQKREERIKEQEIDNLTSSRHLEGVKIKKILNDRGLQIHQIPSDGNCLYAAVAHQLEARDMKVEAEDTKSSVECLRQHVAGYMRTHQADFIPFLTKENGDGYTPDDFEEYCKQTESTPAWGGQLELRRSPRQHRPSLKARSAMEDQPPLKIKREAPSSSPTQRRAAYTKTDQPPMKKRRQTPLCKAAQQQATSYEGDKPAIQNKEKIEQTLVPKPSDQEDKPPIHKREKRELTPLPQLSDQKDIPPRKKRALAPVPQPSNTDFSRPAKNTSPNLLASPIINCYHRQSETCTAACVIVPQIVTQIQNSPIRQGGPQLGELVNQTYGSDGATSSLEYENFETKAVSTVTKGKTKKKKKKKKKKGKNIRLPTPMELCTTACDRAPQNVTQIQNSPIRQGGPQHGELVNQIYGSDGATSSLEYEIIETKAVSTVTTQKTKKKKKTKNGKITQNTAPNLPPAPVINSSHRRNNYLVTQMHLEIPDYLKEKIWKHEYIDLASLIQPESSYLDQPAYHLQVNNMSQISLVQSDPIRKITSIEEWTSAFIRFVAVYSLKFPLETPALMQYAETIRNIADKYRGPAFLEYDSKFRSRRQSTQMAWDRIDPELWILNVLDCPQQSYLNYDQSLGSRGYSSGFLRNTCWEFNRRGECHRPYCRHPHICGYCRGDHSADQCMS